MKNNSYIACNCDSPAILHAFTAAIQDESLASHNSDKASRLSSAIAQAKVLPFAPVASKQTILSFSPAAANPRTLAFARPSIQVYFSPAALSLSRDSRELSASILASFLACVRPRIYSSAPTHVPLSLPAAAAAQTGSYPRGKKEKEKLFSREPRQKAIPLGSGE